MNVVINHCFSLFKAFFRRSIMDEHHKKYECKWQITDPGRRCEIDSKNRNRSCKYCRYLRCLEVGMSAEKSKVGRRRNLLYNQLLANGGKLESKRPRDESTVDAAVQAPKRSRLDLSSLEESGRALKKIASKDPKTSPTNVYLGDILARS